VTAGTVVWVETQDGLSLEGELVLPARARGGAVILHPHPLHGGDLANPVVAAMARGFAEAGFATLRVNFRGVGASDGEHGGGEAERLDAAGALDLLASVVADGPLVLAGYSFGADVALAVVHPRIEAWMAVAPPLGVLPATSLIAAGDHRPKLLVVPQHDQFDPPERVAERTRGWDATSVEIVAMADHFLGAGTGAVSAAAARLGAALVS
jgi:alpha/beta superfamily hydrolase